MGPPPHPALERLIDDPRGRQPVRARPARPAGAARAGFAAGRAPRPAARRDRRPFDRRRDRRSGHGRRPALQGRRQPRRQALRQRSQTRASTGPSSGSSPTDADRRSTRAGVTGSSLSQRDAATLLTIRNSVHLSFTDDPSYLTSLGRRLIGTTVGIGSISLADMTSMTGDAIAAFVGPALGVKGGRSSRRGPRRSPEYPIGVSVLGARPLCLVLGRARGTGSHRRVPRRDTVDRAGRSGSARARGAEAAAVAGDPAVVPGRRRDVGRRRTCRRRSRVSSPRAPGCSRPFWSR